jgi:hypothetical protein
MCPRCAELGSAAMDTAAMDTALKRRTRPPKGQGGFDRVAYQREYMRAYMRRRREARRGSG